VRQTKAYLPARRLADIPKLELQLRSTVFRSVQTEVQTAGYWKNITAFGI